MPHEFADSSDSAAFYLPELNDTYGQIDEKPEPPVEALTPRESLHQTNMRHAREAGAYQVRCHLLCEALREFLPKDSEADSLQVIHARGLIQMCESPL